MRLVIWGAQLDPNRESLNNDVLTWGYRLVKSERAESTGLWYKIRLAGFESFRYHPLGGLHRNWDGVLCTVIYRLEGVNCAGISKAKAYTTFQVFFVRYPVTTPGLHSDQHYPLLHYGSQVPSPDKAGMFVSVGGIEGPHWVLRHK